MKRRSLGVRRPAANAKGSATTSATDRTSVRSVALVALAVFLLALGLSFTLDTFAPPRVEAKTQEQLQQELRDTQRQLEEAREGQRQAEEVKSAAQKDIESLNTRIAELETKVESLSAKEEAAQSKLTAIRDELTQVSSELEKSRSRLAKTEEDLATQQSVLEQRAVDIYKGGGLSFIEILFSTEKLSDLVNRLELLADIVEADNRVLSQIDDLRIKVTAEKTALEEQKSRVSSLEADQAAETKNLENLVAEQQASLDTLDGAKAEKKAVVAKAEQDAAKWAKQEDELLAESRSIEAELAGAGSTVPSSVSGTGQMVWPVNGRLSSPFGMRVHPISRVWKMHTGIDISSSSGTSIKAADSGTVMYVGWRGGYGNCTIVSHGTGLTTLYAHQSSILVSSGQSVAKGEVIGKVGSTGYSTGPHLHFEVRRNGSPVDPLSYL